jgi:membrane-bound ClpP family serine protease
LLELFVLPGAGIFALGGGLMIIISLVLASQTFVLPQNDYQMEQLRDSLFGLAGAGVGVIVAAILLRRYAPHTPLLSHMMLEPPSDEEAEEIAHRESMVDFEHLRGQHGQTTTQLTPSGKALFGNELVDVIADGQLVPRGTPVEVVDVRGNRVLVRSLTNG